MPSERKTPFLLLLLDAAVTILIFNVVAHYWGVSTHFLLTPLLGPILALFVVIYLIDGYRVRTDMLSLDYASQHTIAIAVAMLATLLPSFS